MKRIAVWIGAISVACALVACTNPAAPPGNYGSITGKITSASGQPIAGVVVQVDSGPSGTSGADGTYSIQYVPVTDALSPDTVAVEASSVPRGYSVPASQTNIQVKAGQTTSNVNFVLTPG